MRPHERRIITPAEAIARATIRPRAAPTARPSVGVGGWLRWQLIDRAGRVTRQGEQHNLVLDTYLNAIASSSTPLMRQQSAASLVSHNFAYAAVGTGSVEPDPSDTSLGSEVARSNTNAPIAETWTRTSNGVYENVIVKEFDFADGNGNLTEWGMAPAATGDVYIRELFRDEVGDPTVITKTSSEKLWLTYTFTLTLSPVTPTAASFDITGIGTINGEYAYIGGAATNANDAQATSFIAAGTFATVANANYSGIAVIETQTSWAYATGYTRNTTVAIADDPAVPAYTAGDFHRQVNPKWSTARGNYSDVTGFSIAARRASIAGVGIYFLIDSADRFTKANTHELTINRMPRVDWQREGS